MTDRDQLYTALRNADAAGDTAAASALAAHIRSLDAPTAPVQAPAPQPADEPFAVSAGRAIRDIPRQIGLTARAGLRGVAEGAELFTEPVRRMVTNPILGAMGLPQGERLSRVAASASDAVGLPKPQNANERVVQDAASLMAGAGGLIGGARGLERIGTGLVKSAGASISANPVGQLIGAAGGGGAGSAVREAGGSDLEQFGGSLVGALAAPGLAALAHRGVQAGTRAAQNAINPESVQQAVEQQVRLKLEGVGINWSELEPRVRVGLINEARQAMRTGGELNGEALRRLTDFQSVRGSVPTRGMLSLDPVQITRERNLAKMGANASDSGLQGLARAENQNNQALINSINDIGAGAQGASDSFAVGSRAIGALESGLNRERATIGELYSAARDTAGRSFPLNGQQFTANANRALDDALLGGALPSSVSEHMNRIATGQVPFTVDYAEQLKTAIGNLQRNTSDGQTRMALGVVRRALDDTPVLGLGEQGTMAGARTVNPGNLPAIPGATNLGEQSIEAFNQARRANRAMMSRVESNPALKAIYDEKAAPDNFIQRYVTGSSAKVGDVNRLAQELRNDPEAFSAVRNNIAAWLKERAIGAGTNDEVAKFSATGYRRALDEIGERKLAAFFDPQEISQLRSVGRVADYMTVQPAGSAVNNSNSGALVLGRGVDLLDTMASRVPLFGLGPTVTGVIRGQQQQRALKVPGGLLATPQQQPLGSLLVPAASVGGLLAAPGGY